MSRGALLLVIAAFAFCTGATEQRRVHRLIGGHLRIFHEDSQDTELLTASASGGKERKPGQKPDEEEKKTLSQQVADGKYGLIQKELFAKPLKRPGVLSYESNPEVPKDNINTLGGLTKNDIWLAENHLLVLKGGTYPAHDDKEDNGGSIWPAIDDYKAPSRQVKIPAHPKVPPPFPVQLADDGPLQILGTNSSRTLNGSLDQNAYALPPPEGYEPGTGPFFPAFYPYPANASAGQAPFPIPPGTPGEYPAGAPFPPFLNGTLPPFFASLPPGAAILPPPNQTEPLDEDDPSIYYPPPYSFYYPKDNSSLVPAGPLVPGIILPPPPNFFGPLETTTTTRRTPIRWRVPTTTTPSPTLPTVERTRKPVRVQPVHIPEINNELKPVLTTVPPQKSRTRKPSVTILKPVQPSEEPKVFVYNSERTRPKTVISTTQVPLKVYYSTSNDIESNSITQAPERYHTVPKTTPKTPTQYYYYEETTKKPYYDRYYNSKPVPPPQFIYVTARPYNTQRPRYRFVQQTPKTDTFSIHIAKLQNQIHQYYTTPRPTYRNSPKPVYQFSFQASNYAGQNPENSDDKFRPLPKYSVQIQPAIEIVPTEPPQPVYYQNTTPRPQYYNSDYDYEDKNVTPRPISQYSFQVTPSPVYNNEYYSKPEQDGYFDDNTKQYFTTFGKKIPSGTTPMPQVVPPPPRPRKPKPQTLQGDTAVNYLNPRPQINPDAEYVQQRPNYPQVAKYSSRPQRLKEQGAEIIKAVPVNVPTAEGQPGSYISYQLPGDDGAHFYFLTPQLAQSRDQGAGYYYSQPNAARIRRNKER